MRLEVLVLVNAVLRDRLLRLAEPPRSLDLPRWSKDIIEKTRRTLEGKLSLPSAQTAHLLHQPENPFADAWEEGCDRFIPARANNPKDRHVLAAAVVCGAQTIVTFNRRDFPADALAPWNVAVQSPEEFLIHPYHLDPQDGFRGRSRTSGTAWRVGPIDGHTLQGRCRIRASAPWSPFTSVLVRVTWPQSNPSHPTDASPHGSTTTDSSSSALPNTATLSWKLTSPARFRPTRGKAVLPRSRLIVSISMDCLLCSPPVFPEGEEAADHTDYIRGL